MPKPSPFSSHLRRFLLQSPTACCGPSSCRQLHHSFRLLEASSSQSGEQPSESTESSSPLSGTSPPAPPIHFRLSPLNDDLLMSEDQPTAGSSRPGAMGNEESLAGRRGPPKEKKKYPFMDKDTMDEMLGIDTLHRTGSSSRALRDDDGLLDDSDDSSLDLSALFGTFRPKSQPMGEFTPRPTIGYAVPSPRTRKGVHSRYRRSQGQTPEEAAAFNQVLADIFSDLERQGPLRPGSSPLSDPYGNKFAPDAQLWGPRVREKRRGLGETKREENEEEDAVIEEFDLLKEEMSIMATDTELVEWAKRRVFTPISTDEKGITFSRVYPRILAHVLKVIRTNFNNPHLALALFHHAQTHSAESYLTGCLVPAYNEILRVRWESFRDLEGVEQGVREMEVNGVRWDGGTQRIVGRVVEEVSGEMLENRGQARYGDEVYDRLNRLEARVQKDIRAQDEVYEMKKAERTRVRVGRARERGDLAYA